jgi:hypothetical protein
MKITVTADRECCLHLQDLRPIDGTPRVGRFARYVFCVRCGRHHEYQSVRDAAGAADWEYQRMPNPWEARVKS